MKKIFLLSLVLLCLGNYCKAQKSKLSGKFVRISPVGPVALDFKEDGNVDVDFNNDGSIDVVTVYNQENDIILFEDKEGQACPNAGKYKIFNTDYYTAFDLVEDDCNGRIKMTMGFWVRPNFDELLSELDTKITTSSKPEYLLNRARIYMALGKSEQAKKDFDIYLELETKDARAYVNRAGTRFPFDMQGSVDDCNKALELEPNNINAYFLRGLALYELGKKEEACNDFYKAIDLGFTILKEAEKQKCEDFWKKMIIK